MEFCLLSCKKLRIAPWSLLLWTEWSPPSKGLGQTLDSVQELFIYLLISPTGWGDLETGGHTLFFSMLPAPRTQPRVYTKGMNECRSNYISDRFKIKKYIHVCIYVYVCALPETQAILKVALQRSWRLLVNNVNFLALQQSHLIRGSGAGLGNLNF